MATSASALAEDGILQRVDHLVYAVPDLEEGVRRVEKLFGVLPVPGGRHPGRGTRNALVSLGGTRYLEIIGPDPEQPDPRAPRIFGIDDLDQPRLATWAAKSNDLAGLVEAAAAAGIELGQVAAGSRRRPDGLLLKWQFTDPSVVIHDGLMPFFIDWGETPHPASTLPDCCELLKLEFLHPDAEALARDLRVVGLHATVSGDESARIVAVIRTPNGVVRLD